MSNNEREKDVKPEDRPQGTAEDQPGASLPPGELSRRKFLYMAGVVGMAPVVNGVDPLQITRTKPQIKAKVAEKVVAPIRNLSFSVLRPDDLLALEFECINLEVRAGVPPRLVRKNAAAPAYLVVHFPPQHIAEQAFFETTPGYQPDPKAPAEPTTAETPAPPPVLARIAGPTRLAFFVPKEVAEIPLTLESLLSWEDFEPSLVAVAVPPRVQAASIARGQVQPKAVARVSAAEAVSFAPPAYTPMILPGGAPRQNLHQVRASRLPAQLNLAVLKIAPPAAHQTALELPYRLILSPHALNLWAHAIKAVTRNGRTELWHTRLAAAEPDGTIVDTGSPYMALRAVWSPDCDIENPRPGPGHSNAPFRMSLDRQDRHEIVHLTSNFQLKLGTQAWQPQPVDVDRLMLTSLGGWLDSSGMWLPTPLSVEEWRHKATLGRDHYVKVVYKGFLMPFGHAASLVKITERKFRKGQDGQQIAYLFQRMYIIVRQPEKTFPAPFQAYDGRELPFRKVRITTLMTPPLEDPGASQMVGGALQSAFWPRVQNQDFRFHCVATDWSGQRSEFTTPMAFVDAIYGFDVAKMKAVIGAYNQKSQVERRRPPLNGQKVAFAAPKSRGDTELEVDSLTFAAKDPATHVKVEEWQDADQPLFFPVMEEAAVSIPALKAMVQLGATAIRYPSAYLQNGMGGANKGEIFAALPDAPGLDFGAGHGDRSGGVATPSFPIVGLSRALGPVGGEIVPGGADAMAAAEQALGDVLSGRFDPRKFFDDKAKLLGGILLKDIVQAVADFMSHSDKALTIKNEVQSDANGVPTEIRTLMTWKPDLQDFTIFVARRDGTEATLTIDIRNVVYFDGREPDFTLTGELKDFTLDLIKPIITLIRIKFSKFTFTSKKGQKTDFDPSIAAIEFAGPLDFVKQLLDKIKLPGGDGGGLGQPIVEIDTSRARLGYTFGIPSVAFGVFTLQNITFTGVVTLPFTGDPLNFRFAFNERSNPFLLTVAMFGGGGFFAIELEPNGIKLIEGSLEFGGSFSMDIGVASGGVTLMAGIYFKYEDDNVTITGYVRCAGCLEVLGIISISAEFYLGLTYEQATNRVWGQAKLTVKIKVLFFSAKVTLKVERSFGHSPAPLFTDIMDESHWLDYCEAFA